MKIENFNSEYRWIVLGIGKSNPTAVHNSRESALAEAGRLSNNNPNVEFLVLQIANVVKTEIQYTKMVKNYDSL